MNSHICLAIIEINQHCQCFMKYLWAIASPDYMYWATIHRDLDTLEGGRHVPECDKKNLRDENMWQNEAGAHTWKLTGAFHRQNGSGKYIEMDNLAVWRSGPSLLRVTFLHKFKSSILRWGTNILGLRVQTILIIPFLWKLEAVTWPVPWPECLGTQSR